MSYSNQKQMWLAHPDQRLEKKQIPRDNMCLRNFTSGLARDHNPHV